VVPDGYDFTDPDVYANGVPYEHFAELRRTAPIWWNAQASPCGGFQDGGFWAVTRHADVREISRRSDVFSSWQKGAIIRFGQEMPPERIEMLRLIMLNQDPPQHTKVRGIVSRGFTPKSINSLKDALHDRAERIVTEALARGSGDFVTDVACELPLQAIAELLGVPQEDRGKIFDWSNQMIAYDDPEYEIEPDVASAQLLGYAWNMAEQRRACPMNDIVTKLVQADVDGDALGSDQFGFFVLLLAVAGNETTRNAITHGMQAFFDHPDQWEKFKTDRPLETAVEEIIRWATPVVVFQRTAMSDTVLGGQQIRAGDRVAIFYPSGNRDTAAIADPDVFDVTRESNEHVAFGGGGPHFCLGANLARAEIGILFEAIADRMPDIAPLGPPDRLRSSFIHGIKRLPVRYA